MNRGVIQCLVDCGAVLLPALNLCALEEWGTGLEAKKLLM